MPYLVYTLKNYSPVVFYEKLIEMVSHVSSGNMLLKRLQSAPALFPAGYNLVKTLGNRQMIGRLRQILNLLNGLVQKQIWLLIFLKQGENSLMM